MVRLLGIVIIVFFVFLYSVIGVTALVYVIALVVLGAGALLWQRRTSPAPGRRLQERIDAGDPRPLVVRAYRSDAEFERDAEALRNLGYVIESRHFGAGASSSRGRQSMWHVTYGRSTAGGTRTP